MLDFRFKYSITELAAKWECSEKSIINYIDDGFLPLYCKTYVVTYITGDATSRISIPIRNRDKATDLLKLVDDCNVKHPVDNPLLPNNCTVTVGDDCCIANDALVDKQLADLKISKQQIYSALQSKELTEKEAQEKLNLIDDKISAPEECRFSEILIANSIEKFSECFIYHDDVETIENQLTIKNPEKSIHTTRIKQPTIQRANSFNDCFAQVMVDFTESNGYPPTTIEEVINRMKHTPPLGVIINFCDAGVSIDGSTPKAMSKVNRAIKRLLVQQES